MKFFFPACSYSLFKIVILYCYLLLFCIRLGIILHQTGMGHNHSHGGGSHSHRASHSNHNGNVESVSTNRISRSASLSTEKQNINVRAAFIHVLGDIVQSVGVLIAAYIIKFKVKHSSMCIHRGFNKSRLAAVYRHL